MASWRERANYLSILFLPDRCQLRLSNIAPRCDRVSPGARSGSSGENVNKRMASKQPAYSCCYHSNNQTNRSTNIEYLPFCSRVCVVRRLRRVNLLQIARRRYAIGNQSNTMAAMRQHQWRAGGLGERSGRAWGAPGRAWPIWAGLGRAGRPNGLGLRNAARRCRPAALRRCYHDNFIIYGTPWQSYKHGA